MCSWFLLIFFIKKITVTLEWHINQEVEFFLFSNVESIIKIDIGKKTMKDIYYIEDAFVWEDKGVFKPFAVIHCKVFFLDDQENQKLQEYIK